MKKTKEKWGTFNTPDVKTYTPNKQNTFLSKDKGELYDFILNQKQIVHNMKEDNLILKSKLRQQQKKKVSKNKVIKELEVRIRNPTIKGYLTKRNPHLLNSLKAKKQEALVDNGKLKKEIKKLQKCVMFTKINELKGARKMYNIERKRLSEMINKTETKDNIIPIKSINMIKARIRNQKKMLSLLSNEHKKLIKELERRELEIEKYKKIVIDQQRKNINGNEFDNIDHDFTEEDLENLKRERDEAKEKIEKQKLKINELENKIKEIEKSKDLEIKQIQEHYAKNKIKLINEDEVNEIGKTLISNLKWKEIRMQNIKNRIFEHFDNEEKVSLYELSKIFARPPCNIVPNDSQKLGEYLIGQPSNETEQKYNKFMEERRLSEVLEKLCSLLLIALEHERNEKNDELNELENLSEHELMAIFQRYFSKIDTKLKILGKTIEEIFKDLSFTKVVDGENAIVIKSTDFLKICKEKLNIEFNSTESVCFLKMLSTNDNEELLKLQDLIVIMKEFEAGSEETEKFDMNFKELDNISLAIIYNLTEYIINSKKSIIDIFGKHIYTQDVQIDEEQLQIDIIDSDNFSNILEDIGIDIKINNNLKKFLCIDPEYLHKLVVKKLKRTIEEFVIN